MRSLVSVEERVAVTVGKLATNVEYRTLSSVFGLGRSTVGEIVIETCEVITSKLMSKYVYIPQDCRLREVVDGFETCWGFPQVAGAIDGSHIPIICPKDNPSDYYNRKGFTLLLCRHLWTSEDYSWMCTLDGLGRCMISNSAIYRRGGEGTLLPSWNRQINGIQVL